MPKKNLERIHLVAWFIVVIGNVLGNVDLSDVFIQRCVELFGEVRRKRLKFINISLFQTIVNFTFNVQTLRPRHHSWTHPKSRWDSKVCVLKFQLNCNLLTNFDVGLKFTTRKTKKKLKVKRSDRRCDESQEWITTGNFFFVLSQQNLNMKFDTLPKSLI